jgi:hypothetical protein
MIFDFVLLILPVIIGEFIFFTVLPVNLEVGKSSTLFYTLIVRCFARRLLLLLNNNTHPAPRPPQKKKIIKRYYSGRWKNGEMHNKGHLTYPKDHESKRVSFKGKFKDGQPSSGKSKIVYRDGSKYSGYIQNDLYNGFGRYTYSKEDQKKDAEDGNSQREEEDKDFYEGLWKDSQKSGQGKLVFKHGDIYEGNFEDDKFHGYGTLTYSSTEAYSEGQWKDGELSGKTKILWKNGGKFECDDDEDAEANSSDND